MTGSPPIFVLAAPRSYTSLFAAMLGQHPACFGVPELNLFVADGVEELMSRMTNMRQIQLHGLLRCVGQVYGGEQTIDSVDMAKRWLFARMDYTAGQVFGELRARLAGRHIVDKSPSYVTEPDILRRLHQACPDALYVHLTRHPLTQGESLMRLANGALAVANNSVDYSTQPPTIDPQFLWLETQRNILDFLADIPVDRQVRVTGETFIEAPVDEVSRACQALGLAIHEAAQTRISRPEDSPFAGPGPVGAHLGNDINFIRSPQLRVTQASARQLDEPLPWRPDGAGLQPDVRALARHLGYT